MKVLACAILVLGLVLALSNASAQSPRGAPRPREPKDAPTKPAEAEPGLPQNDQDIETIKIDTNLVTVPVIASSRTGAYIADLKKEELEFQRTVRHKRSLSSRR